MPPHVTLTRRADQRYTAAVHAGQMLEKANDDRAELVRRLETAFADAIDVVVLNYYVGFKARPGEHIMRVDVFRAKVANTYVVKLAGHERLVRECAAWAQCRLNDANPVFMPLMAVPDSEHSERLCAIAYQDAETHIGAESTQWLETAVQHCVRFDRPTLASIRAVFRDVYAQMGRLYEFARLESPGNGGIETMPARDQAGKRHRMGTSLELWNRPAGLAVRRRVNAAFPVGFASFLDPVDYFQFVDGEQQKTSVLPAQMRGLAHGDLHGRNLLVGIDDRDEANFPSVFDYEHIHHDNLVGWDFVEMETELKIRCFERLFPERNETARARRIQAFEWRLNERTRRAHDTRDWADESDRGSTPEDRLFSILLAIRHEACETLGQLRARSSEWLHEYLFLLGAYGLTTARYENQTPPERTAAYLSAGVAAAYWEKLRGARDAPALDLAALTAAAHPGHGVPLLVARKWNRGSPQERSAAEELLRHLIERYPAALHVWYEWAFNHAEQGRSKDAIKALERIYAIFGDELGEDTYSLWGRCYKQLGDQYLQKGQSATALPDQRRAAFDEADLAYGQAITQYQRAYDADAGFFSGINLATLLFLRAGLNTYRDRAAEAATFRKQSIDLAAKVKNSTLSGSLLDDNIWQRATIAEAAVLCRDWTYAALRYRAALDQDNSQPQHAASMGRQLRRLIDAYSLLGETVPREPFAIVPELLVYFPEENQ